MKRLRRYVSVAVLLIGLGLIFLYFKPKAPQQGSVRFALPAEWKEASRVKLDYRSAKDGGKECLRYLELFPRAPVIEIRDEPSLPEGDYVIVVTLEAGQGAWTLEQAYHHEAGALVRFTLTP